MINLGYVALRTGTTTSVPQGSVTPSATKASRPPARLTFAGEPDPALTAPPLPALPAVDAAPGGTITVTGGWTGSYTFEPGVSCTLESGFYRYDAAGKGPGSFDLVLKVGVDFDEVRPELEPFQIEIGFDDDQNYSYSAYSKSTQSEGAVPFPTNFKRSADGRSVTFAGLTFSSSNSNSALDHIVPFAVSGTVTCAGNFG